MYKQKLFWLMAVAIVVVSLLLFWLLRNSDIQTRAHDDSSITQRQIDARQDVAIQKIAQSLSQLIKTMGSECSADKFGNIEDPCPGICDDGSNDQCVGDECDACNNINSDDLSSGFDAGSVIIPNVVSASVNIQQRVAYASEEQELSDEEKMEKRMGVETLEKNLGFLIKVENNLKKISNMARMASDSHLCGLATVYMQLESSVAKNQRKLNITPVRKYMQSIIDKQKRGVLTIEEKKAAHEFLYVAFAYKDDKSGEIKRGEKGYLQTVYDYILGVQAYVRKVKENSTCAGCRPNQSDWDKLQETILAPIFVPIFRLFL